MTELGTLFDINEVPDHLEIKRNVDGSLKASDLKAIQWYMVQHGLKPAAASAFPMIYFRSSEGIESQVNIMDIKGEYETFKLASHSKKNAA